METKIRRGVFFTFFILLGLLFSACDIPVNSNCVIGTTTCRGEDAYVLCSSEGLWSSPINCPNEESCVAGACTDTNRLPCEEFGITCQDHNTLRKCDEIGSPPILIPCDGLSCVKGECVELCKQNSNQCISATQLQLCTAGDRPVIHSCEDAEICVEDACVEACTENYVTCNDIETVVHCEKGRPAVFEKCQGDKPVCFENACAEDLCHNGKRDRDEELADCGGEYCAPCQSCTKDSDCESGFCDKIQGSFCSYKCKQNKDCKDHDQPMGEFCRSDGRCTSKVFETVWEIPHANYSLKLPHSGSGTCSFEILWGDEDANNPSPTHVTSCTRLGHTYKKPGTYTIRLWGHYDGWGYSEYKEPSNDPQAKLLEVKSFGPVIFDQYAFCNTGDVILPKNESPYGLHTMLGFFKNSQINQPLNHWDVSSVTTMKEAFQNATVFNQPLSHWDTSKVTDMSDMFSTKTLYPHSIIMHFYKGSDFNQPLDNWNTTNVTDMQFMFAGAKKFNQSINHWDTSKVTDMQFMFTEAHQFNHPLEHFNTANVTSMLGMFRNASSFNQPIGNWDTHNVTDMTLMFSGAKAFNQFIGNWDISKVTSFSYMFEDTGSFNQPLSNWKTSQVTDMSSMFSNARAFDQSLAHFNTGSVESFRHMFDYCNIKRDEPEFVAPFSTQHFNELRYWNVSSGVFFEYMFACADHFDIDLSSWNIEVGSDPNLCHIYALQMFDGSGLSEATYCQMMKDPRWYACQELLMSAYTCP